MHIIFHYLIFNPVNLVYFLFNISNIFLFSYFQPTYVVVFKEFLVDSI